MLLKFRIIVLFTASFYQSYCQRLPIANDGLQILTFTANGQGYRRYRPILLKPRQDVTFDCSVGSATSTTSISILNDSLHVLATVSGVKQLTFTLNKMECANSGQFYCLAVQGQVNVTSRLGLLATPCPPRICFMEQTEKTKTVALGKTAMFYMCTIVDIDLWSSLTLYLNGEPLTVYQTKFRLSYDYVEGYNGYVNMTLYIYDIQPTDYKRNVVEVGTSYDNIDIRVYANIRGEGDPCPLDWCSSENRTCLQVYGPSTKVFVAQERCKWADGFIGKQTIFPACVDDKLDSQNVTKILVPATSGWCHLLDWNRNQSGPDFRCLSRNVPPFHFVCEKLYWSSATWPPAVTFDPDNFTDAELYEPEPAPGSDNSLLLVGFVPSMALALLLFVIILVVFFFSRAKTKQNSSAQENEYEFIPAAVTGRRGLKTILCRCLGDIRLQIIRRGTNSESTNNLQENTTDSESQSDKSRPDLPAKRRKVGDTDELDDSRTHSSDDTRELKHTSGDSQNKYITAVDVVDVVGDEFNTSDEGCSAASNVVIGRPVRQDFCIGDTKENKLHELDGFIENYYIISTSNYRKVVESHNISHDKSIIDKCETLQDDEYITPLDILPGSSDRIMSSDEYITPIHTISVSDSEKYITPVELSVDLVNDGYHKLNLVSHGLIISSAINQSTNEFSTKQNYNQTTYDSEGHQLNGTFKESYPERDDYENKIGIINTTPGSLFCEKFEKMCNCQSHDSTEHLQTCHLLKATRIETNDTQTRQSDCGYINQKTQRQCANSSSSHEHENTHTTRDDSFQSETLCKAPHKSIFVDNSQGKFTHEIMKNPVQFLDNTESNVKLDFRSDDILHTRNNQSNNVATTTELVTNGSMNGRQDEKHEYFSQDALTQLDTGYITPTDCYYVGGVSRCVCGLSKAEPRDALNIGESNVCQDELLKWTENWTNIDTLKQNEDSPEVHRFTPIRHK